MMLSLSYTLAIATAVLQFAATSSPVESKLKVPTDYTKNPVVHPEETGKGPRRIVSIAPSITEMCAALGLADRVVGRTQYCQHPPAVLQAAIIGAYADTNFEKVIALKPDLVLITTSSLKLIDSLKGLNLPYETVPDSTLEDVYTAIAKLGRLCERPKTAEMLINNLIKDLQTLQQQGSSPQPAKVLFTFSSLPTEARSIYVAGPNSYLDDLLKRAGYTNATSAVLKKPWGMISVETILAIKPDAILEVRTDQGQITPDKLYRGWSCLESVPAFKERRIRSLTDDAVTRPGPRVNLVLYDIIKTLSE